MLTIDKVQDLESRIEDLESKLQRYIKVLNIHQEVLEMNQGDIASINEGLEKLEDA